MREWWESLLAFFRIESRGGAYWALAFAAAVYLVWKEFAARKTCGNAGEDAVQDRENLPDGEEQPDGGNLSDGENLPDGGKQPDSEEKPAAHTWRRLLVCVVWFILWMNPLTAWLFQKIMILPYRYVYASLMVPILPVIAVAAADILRRSQRRTLTTALFLVSALMLAGTVFPFDEKGGTPRRSAQWDDAERGAVETVLSEAQQFKENGQVPLLAAPKSMMDVIRRYDADILLAYGRNLWQTDALFFVYDKYTEEQVLLCQAMEAEPFQAAQTAELALAYGCNLIVLKEPLDAAFLDNRGLSCVYESERLYVYSR